MEYQDHQSRFQEFVRRWPMDAAYYIWGTSHTAEELCSLFQGRLNILGFVDSDAGKWGTRLFDRPVLSPEEFFAKRGRTQCIIASIAYGEIIFNLERRGFVNGADMCVSWRFLGIHRYMACRKLHLLRANLFITSYCTLRCRHCSMKIPYFKRHRHDSAEAVLSTVDSYFRWVDYVERFDILGGEPFLHPNIEEITGQIAERYSERISQLSLFSNGTITPSNRMLEIMKQYRIKVDLGDYRKCVPGIRSQVGLFLQVLESHGIDYSLPANDWVDLTYVAEDRTNWGPEKMSEVCRNCGVRCQTLYDEKLYYCYMGLGASLSEYCAEEPGDYFDLSASEHQDKGKLLAFDLDCAPKGYVAYCQHCGGWRGTNQHAVPAGEQLPAGMAGNPETEERDIT